jgi:hypothetical protein
MAAPGVLLVSHALPVIRRLGWRWVDRMGSESRWSIGPHRPLTAEGPGNERRARSSQGEGVRERTDPSCREAS